MKQKVSCGSFCGLVGVLLPQGCGTLTKRKQVYLSLVEMIPAKFDGVHPDIINYLDEELWLKLRFSVIYDIKSFIFIDFYNQNV